MKKEYDFPNAEQGKFYCSPEDLRIAALFLIVKL